MGSADRVKFVNFKCFKIEQNCTSPCSLPIIVYESILGFSYSSSFCIQIRPKKTLLSIFLLIYLAKYNKAISMRAKFLMITFKQSCVIMFLRFFSRNLSFLKKSLQAPFLAGRAVGGEFFPPSSFWCQWQGTFKGSFMQNFNQIGQLLWKLCHFLIFSSGRLVGLVGLHNIF